MVEPQAEKPLRVQFAITVIIHDGSGGPVVRYERGSGEKMVSVEEAMDALHEASERVPRIGDLARTRRPLSVPGAP